MPRTTKAKAATYRVCNPGGAPAGTTIIHCGDRRWFEGDILDVAEANAAARVTIDVERFLRAGLLEEVS